MPKINKLLKVGFVLDDSLDKTDGVQQYILSLGEWLKSQGHEVHYLVGSTHRTDLDKVHSLSKNINVRFNGNRMSMPLPASRKKLETLLKDEEFDVLHIQLPYSPYLAHRIIMLAPHQTALVGTFHIVGDSQLVKTATKLLGSWTKQSLRKFDCIMSVSEAAQLFAEKTFSIQTQVVPNVFDYTRFHTSTPLPKYTDKATVLFLGRLVPRKGCLHLLKAIHILAEDPTMPPFQVLICGKGPLEAKLIAYSKSHSLNKIVHFLGYVSEDDKPSYFASANVSVFPSLSGESFGIVLLEAMAHGTSVVLGGHNIGYMSVLKDNPDLLFDPFNTKQLANKIKYYLLSSTQRKHILNWETKYSQTFDVAQIGPKVITIYNEALRKPKQP